MLNHDVDDVVAEGGHVTGPDVIVPAVRERRIEHLLMLKKRLRLAEIEYGRTEFLKGPHHPFTILDRSRVAGGDAQDMFAHQVGRNDRQCRRPPLHGDCHELVGAVRDPVPIKAEHFRGVVHGPEDRTRHNVRTHRVKPELEVGDDAEVAATAPHAPEEVGVLELARPDQPAVGGNHVHG